MQDHKCARSSELKGSPSAAAEYALNLRPLRATRRLVSDAALADLRIEFADLPAGVQVRGRLMGPRCPGISTVEIAYQGKTERIQNEAIIINAGGVLPTDFLKGIGIEIETKFGTR